MITNRQREKDQKFVKELNRKYEQDQQNKVLNQVLAHRSVPLSSASPSSALGVVSAGASTSGAHISGGSNSAMYTKKQSRAMKKALISQEGISAHRELAGKENVKYMKMLIDPFDEETVLAPSATPLSGTTVRVKLFKDLSDNNVNGLDGTGTFQGMLIPEISNALWLTPPKNFSPSVTASVGAVMRFIAITGGVPAEVEGKSYHYESGFARNLNYLQLVTSEGGSGVIITNLFAAQSLTVTAEIKGGDEDLRYVNFTFSVFRAGAWTVLFVLPLYKNQISTITQAVLANDINMRFAITAGNVSNYDGVTISFNITSSTNNIPNAQGGGNNDVLKMIPYDFEFAGSIKELEWSMLASEEIVITYQGTDFANGGRVTGAQVSATWSPVVPYTSPDYASSIFNEISTLPLRTYDGPLKDGLHGHWQPTDPSDLLPTYVGKNAAKRGSMIVFSGKMSDNTQSNRLRVTAVIQFFSANPVYGCMRISPPLYETSLLLNYMYRCVPAITCNPAHRTLKSSAVKYVSQALRYLKDNPERLAEIASIISTALKAAAVIL